MKGVWSHTVSLRTVGTGTRVVVGTIACLGTLVASGCHKQDQAASHPPTVEVTAVIQRDVPIYKEWVGALDGNVNAVIRPQVTGYLIRQNYLEGALVKKGQVLFEIDPRPFQVALEQAKAQLAQQKARHDTAKANLDRIRPLAAKNAVSQKDLDDATGNELSSRASVQAAQASVDSAKLNLGFTKIISPVDGVAGIAKTQLGNLVGPSMPTELTSVSALNPIKAYINVSEQEYLKTRESNEHIETVPLELILADGSVYPHKGRFALSDRQVDPTTGTLKVGSLFENRDNLLRPGQYGRVRAVIGIRKGALLVPQRAVAEIQGNFLVAVVTPDNKADIRPVKVAERVGTLWVVEEGLKPGEKVIVEGIQKVKPGSPIDPKPYTPDAEGKGAPETPKGKGAAPAGQEKR